MSGAGVLGLGALSPKGSVTPSQQPPTRVLDDPRAEHGTVVFKHGGKDTFDGFLARPKKAGAFSAVLVVAGNRITEEYIPNTCAALALADFVGLAPNIFHPLPAAPRHQRRSMRPSRTTPTTTCSRTSKWQPITSGPSPS